MADWNTVNAVGMEVVPVADAAEATTAELVDLVHAMHFTGDMSAMVAKKYTLELTDAEGSSVMARLRSMDCSRTTIQRSL